MSGDEGFARAFPDVMQREYDNELANRFTYHPPKPGQAELYERIRAAGLAFARELNAYCPASQELALAFNAVDQAVMWANASIAREE